MKKISILVMALALVAMLMMVPATQASISANILYSETDLGGGFWQYDYLFENTSSVGDSHPYLQEVDLYPGGQTTVTVLNMPADWTSYTFTGKADLNTPVVTDYLEMYSGILSADVSPGSLLGGFVFTADYQLGNIAYDAVFSDHGTLEAFTTISGTTSVVPIPGAVWLLASGLAGLVGIRRKMGR